MPGPPRFPSLGPGPGRVCCSGNDMWADTLSVACEPLPLQCPRPQKLYHFWVFLLFIKYLACSFRQHCDGDA